MNYRKAFEVEPGSRVRLADFDPGLTDSDEKKKHVHRVVVIEERCLRTTYIGAGAKSRIPAEGRSEKGA